MLDRLTNQLTEKLLKENEKIRKIKKDCLLEIVRTELFEILQPTLATFPSLNCSKNKQHKFYRPFENLLNVAEARIHRVGKMLCSVVEALSNYGNQKFLDRKEETFNLKMLSGDSHSGGFRPILVRGSDSGSMVLKFADPRPSQILIEILNWLSKSLSVDLNPPQCFPDSDNQWYLMDYLEENNYASCDPVILMYSLGVLTAVAYCLGFVDLHLENVVVKGSKPIIIDPECIFYCFSDFETISERLLSTGFLSHNVHLSTLRGGISPNVPLYGFGLHIDVDGCLRYKRPAPIHGNKIKLDNGCFADPCNYRGEVISGYSAGYKWFVKNVDQVRNLLLKYMPDDFRVRFLVRKTRHYASVIYMLNLPGEKNYDLWVDYVFQRFRKSGYFPESVSESLMVAEIGDMKNRDIPYFWMRAGENGIIRHQSGEVHQLNFKENVRSRAINHLQMLRDTDMAEHISVINKFLDIDISRPPV